jgi:hypothetical protein
VPSKLITKLRTLGLNTSLWNWILDFLTGRPQVVRVGNNTSDTLILNTGAPQECVLSPLLYSLYSLFTHDCKARHNCNTIIKYADDTTVVGLITDTSITSNTLTLYIVSTLTLHRYTLDRASLLLFTAARYYLLFLSLTFFVVFSQNWIVVIKHFTYTCCIQRVWQIQFHFISFDRYIKLSTQPCNLHRQTLAIECPYWIAYWLSN